jgi:hypothetical protein
MLSFFRVAFRENEEACGFGKSLVDFLWRSQAPLIVHQSVSNRTRKTVLLEIFLCHYKHFY